MNLDLHRERKLFWYTLYISEKCFPVDRTGNSFKIASYMLHDMWAFIHSELAVCLPGIRPESEAKPSKDWVLNERCILEEHRWAGMGGATRRSSEFESLCIDGGNLSRFTWALHLIMDLHPSDIIRLSTWITHFALALEMSYSYVWRSCRIHQTRTGDSIARLEFLTRRSP